MWAECRETERVLSAQLASYVMGTLRPLMDLDKQGEKEREKLPENLYIYANLKKKRVRGKDQREEDI